MEGKKIVDSWLPRPRPCVWLALCLLTSQPDWLNQWCQWWWMEFVLPHIFSKWLLLFSLFTKPLSAALRTRCTNVPMYKSEGLQEGICSENSSYGEGAWPSLWGITRLLVLFQREWGQKGHSLLWPSEGSRYVGFQQRSEHVGGLGRAQPALAPSCREGFWPWDAMSRGRSGWWAVGILSLCFGEPSSCFHLAEAQISQYSSLPEMGANFHIRASLGGRSRCRAGRWGAAEPPVHAAGAHGGSAPDSH